MGLSLMKEETDITSLLFFSLKSCSFCMSTHVFWRILAGFLGISFGDIFGGDLWGSWGGGGGGGGFDFVCVYFLYQLLLSSSSDFVLELYPGCLVFHLIFVCDRCD